MKPHPRTDPVKRPQRTLTEQEWKVVRGLPALCLHRALFLGLVDPVPAPSPMSEEDGAWVREHAWLRFHRELEKGYPWGYWRYGHSERGTCWNCLNRRCDLCVHRQQCGPSVDDGVDWVTNHRGHTIATFLTVAPGQRPCSWACRCPCPKTAETPPHGRPEPTTADTGPPLRQPPALPPPPLPEGWEQPLLPI